ncbi:MULTISPECIES: WXG100 family type VII secretion target [Thermomonospora]|uniref:WXG100 family type VII secretion target n=1 Tax=Thermomonospora cellulosilytica TaxID=1411118 RepID=A0A7W3MWG1_9ACTN|nr:MULTISPECIES: WXG100 family type VII secretion target [Thermomonospora]MBA9003174.1 WXG100 family type VII secretion target [Thermomonospora cellulosilytica]MBA9003180.1 WXG100 family type VII secretion target [Thermomonospora cellulosilytica]
MTDDSYTRANFGGLTEGEAQFSMAARALMDELNDLEAKLRTKLNRWDGQAQQAYWQFQKEWDAAAKDMQNVVTQLGVAIADANANYQAAERANMGIWSG